MSIFLCVCEYSYFYASLNVRLFEYIDGSFLRRIIFFVLSFELIVVLLEMLH